MSNEETQMNDSLSLRLFDEHGNLKFSTGNIKEPILMRLLRSYKRWLFS